MFWMIYKPQGMKCILLFMWVFYSCSRTRYEIILYFMTKSHKIHHILKAIIDDYVCLI